MRERLGTMVRLTICRWTVVMTNSDLTLVLGGTGKTGRRVAARLRALGRPVRIGSRAADPPFDWDDPATWTAPLSGATAVYVTYQPDLAFPGAAETVGAFARQAAAAGVRRLVLLSGRGEDGALTAEKAVAGAGVPWAVVRSAFFMQNFSEDFLAGAVADGVVALPAGGVAEPFVDAEDIADVAVAALTGAVPLERVYEVTGPRALTFAEAAAAISAAAGRPVRYVPISVADFVAGAVEAGFPAEVAAGLGEVFATVLDGRNTAPAAGVAEALGRPPRDFAAFAATAWGAP
jgi:uncharacterized protein YbjT (DUF2867 family)